jgi:hypothetical protein
MLWPDPKSLCLGIWLVKVIHKMLRCGRGWISLSTVMVTGMSKIWMLIQLTRHDLHGSNSLAHVLALASNSMVCIPT